MATGGPAGGAPPPKAPPATAGAATALTVGARTEVAAGPGIAMGGTEAATVLRWVDAAVSALRVLHAARLLCCIVVRFV